VEDETIVLTEDEDETVVSSHDYNEYATDTEEVNEGDDETQQVQVSVNGDDDEEEVFVDVLGSDDDEDEATDLVATRLQAQLIETTALKRNELLYEDEELHNQAVNGLARLFDRDFPEPDVEVSGLAELQSNSGKTYTDLSGVATAEIRTTSSDNLPPPPPPPPAPATSTIPATPPLPPPPISRPHKAERRRSKLRKHMAIDEETISPVSGTIIRKLRDDEELVVRKGDIDPAFNVVEITEEAKAILASIDNKIGDYMCQLCRTVYDDAFMLAQHRCPRIVHIEYKCSECEKVCGRKEGFAFQATKTLFPCRSLIARPTWPPIADGTSPKRRRLELIPPRNELWKRAIWYRRRLGAAMMPAMAFILAIYAERLFDGELVRLSEKKLYNLISYLVFKKVEILNIFKQLI